MNDNRDHLRALFAAYLEASGSTLTLSPQRMNTLREFDRRGITPNDVRWVVQVLKSRVARGVPGYGDTSLEWHNAMGVKNDIDRFENRLSTLKAAKARKLGQAREASAAVPTAVRVQTGAGETVSRLDVRTDAAAEVPRMNIEEGRAALRALADDLGKGASAR